MLHQQNTSGKSAGSTFPSIVTDILKIQFAKQLGDKNKEDVAKQQYDAKVAAMKAKLQEKHLNEMNAAHQKLMEAKNATEQLKQSQNVNIAAIKATGEVEKQKVANVGLRDVQIQKDAGELERQDDTQQFELRKFADELNYIRTQFPGMLDDAEIETAIKRKYGEPEKSEEQIMYELIYSNPNISAQEKSERYRMYKGIKEGTGGNGSGTGAGAGRNKALTDSARTGVMESVIQAMLRNSPIETRDQGKGVFNLAETEGANPTPEQHWKSAQDMATAAMQAQAFDPTQFRSYYETQKSLAYKTRSQTTGHSTGTAGTGGVEFEKPIDPNKKDAGDKMAAHNTHIHAQKFINFVESDAGEAFERWLSESVAAGQFTMPWKLSGPQPGGGGATSPTTGTPERVQGTAELDEGTKERLNKTLETVTLPGRQSSTQAYSKLRETANKIGMLASIEHNSSSKGSGGLFGRPDWRPWRVGADYRGIDVIQTVLGYGIEDKLHLNPGVVFNPIGLTIEPQPGVKVQITDGAGPRNGEVVIIPAALLHRTEPVY